MSEKNKKKKKKYSKFRENFMPSSFEWLSLDEQKKKAENLEKITKNNKDV